MEQGFLRTLFSSLFTVVKVHTLRKWMNSFAKLVFLYFIQLKLNTDFTLLNFFLIFAKSVINFNCIKYNNTNFANEFIHLRSQYTLTLIINWKRFLKVFFQTLVACKFYFYFLLVAMEKQHLKAVKPLDYKPAWLPDHFTYFFSILYWMYKYRNKDFNSKCFFLQSSLKYLCILRLWQDSTPDG